MTVPVVAVVGLSNSGKTRMVTGLVRAFHGRGYRVAAIKHASHGHDPGPPGKDSVRFQDTGAQEVVVSSPDRITRTVRRSEDESLERLVAGLIASADIVIAEGFKHSGVPKVLIEGEGVIDPCPSNIVAVVGDGPQGVNPPRFATDCVEELAAYLEDLLVTPQGARDHTAAGARISLIVDGAPVRLKKYPASALEETLRGFLRSLHGVSTSPRTIELRLER
jgi:molybdopterin-guanine dinucleotide biosynthesis protein B